jgi:hypothetical protein
MPRHKEATMPDNLTDRGPQDRSRISMEEEHEVRYWTKKFGVSRQELEAAVKRAGASAAAVAKELGKTL